MKKEEIINYLIKENGYTSYLEVGVGFGHNFNKIICDNKKGFDINNGISSDAFFESNNEVFDIIFIDADHNHKQCEKDILNALKCLSKDGVIVMHDINPETIDMQSVPRKQRIWTGNVWRCYVGYPGPKKAYLDDYGVGVLYPSDTQEGFSSDIDAEVFLLNKDKYLLNQELPVIQQESKPKRKSRK